MPGERSLSEVLRNLLTHSDLPFREFVERVLDHPEFGYDARSQSPVGREGDFITSPLLSPVFSFALGRLVDEFVSRAGDGVSQVVDMGCGDGELICALARGVGSGAWGVGGEKTGASSSTPHPPHPTPQFFGLDRNLGRAKPDPRITYVTSLGE